MMNDVPSDHKSHRGDSEERWGCIGRGRPETDRTVDYIQLVGFWLTPVTMGSQIEGAGEAFYWEQSPE